MSKIDSAVGCQCPDALCDIVSAFHEQLRYSEAAGRSLNHEFLQLQNITTSTITLNETREQYLLKNIISLLYL